MLQMYALFFPADNPMQAEEADGQPLGGSNNCRTCDIGGTEETKRTEEGYMALFKVNWLFYMLRASLIYLSSQVTFDRHQIPLVKSNNYWSYPQSLAKRRRLRNCLVNGESRIHSHGL